MDEAFRGAQKVGAWWTARWEREFVAWGVERVPGWLETHHLTLLTLGWSALAVASGWAASGLGSGGRGTAWLWGIHIAILGQYLSDLFDGAVGRHRDTGLVRWGFYMDHFLDFVFLASIWIAYLWLLPSTVLPWLLLVAVLSGALMAHSFLAFGASGEFRISHWGMGPTELRATLLGLNTAVVVLGAPWLANLLPWICAGAALALTALVYQTQRTLWGRDMAAKGTRAPGRSGTL